MDLRSYSSSSTMDCDNVNDTSEEFRERPPDLSSSSMVSIFCHRLRKNWKIIVLGQTLSFLLASAGAAQATLHFSCGSSSPIFAMVLVYLGLSIIHLPILFWRKRRSVSLKSESVPTHDDVNVRHVGESNNLTRGDAHCSADTSSSDTNSKPWSLRWYILLAFFDVEANVVTVMAFRYTTLTSVTLFDALAIPAAMAISRCFIFRSTHRYYALHFIGVLVCMIGVVLNVFQDYNSDKDSTENQEYPNKVWGDLCAITGGILFGLNDVLTEATVSKTGDTIEYLGMVGFFGFLISFFQFLLFEREEVRDFYPQNNDGDSTAVCSLQSKVLLLFAFVGVTICSYVGASRFLIFSEAAFFNLSLLTGDLWSVIFSVVAERIVPQPLFFAALFAVLSGVVIYEMAPNPVLEDQRQHNREAETSTEELKEGGEIDDNQATELPHLQAGNSQTLEFV